MTINADEKIARDWIDMIESEKARIREGDIYPILDSWINYANPSKVLDMGSGQGVCSDKIDLTNRNYTGIDQSPLLVERAKQLYSSPNRNFVLGSVYQMPFAENSFDAVFSVAVWHVLQDLHKAAGELSRVLKSKGHFLIITANPGDHSFWKNLSTDAEKIYLHTYDKMVNSLQTVQLNVQKTETFRNFISIQGQKS